MEKSLIPKAREENMEENKEKVGVNTTETEHTTTTETETNQVTEQVEDLDEFEFDEGSNDGSREQDSKDAETQNTTKQSREENHKFAEMRRQQQKEVEDSYKKGLVEGIGGVNPYTKEKIEDDYDIEIYQNMKKIERLGGDPVEEYPKYLKRFRQEELEKEEQAKTEEQRQQEQVQKNIREFQEKYPNVDIKALVGDENFKEFAEESMNRGEPILSAYERFNAYNSKRNKQVEAKARKIAAKKVSSPGSMTSNSEAPKQKSFANMSLEEVAEYRKSLGY